MKKIFRVFTLALVVLSTACSESAQPTQSIESSSTETPIGQSGIKDETSQPNVVQIAVGSTDHSTLVKAVQTAELVDALSNAGPFTVFAPTNAAFEKLPAGTVAGLLQSDKRDALTDILQYHVYVGVLKTEDLTDGRVIGQVNGGNVKVSIQNGKPLLNGKAHIVASIPASNGIIHVIDEVLLPQ